MATLQVQQTMPTWGKPNQINIAHMWGRGVSVSNLDKLTEQKQRQELLEALQSALTLDEDTTCVFGSVPLTLTNKGLELGNFEWDKAIPSKKTSGLQETVVNPLKEQVKQMLICSGQLEMMGQHAKEGFAYDVSIDYYYLRALANVKFHKDTLGQTLFIHLAFSNKDDILGPEWIVDMGPGEVNEAAALREHENELPKSFQTDLLIARSSWKEFALRKEELQKGEKSDAYRIWGEVLKPYGTVSFNDALIIHTTPDPTSRNDEANKLTTIKHFDEVSSGETKDHDLPKPAVANRSRSYSDAKKFENTKLLEDTRNAKRSFIRLEVRAIKQNT